MKSNLILNTINQLLEEIKTIKVKEKNIEKYAKELKKVKLEYEKISINDKYRNQYNQMNKKGLDLLHELRNYNNKEHSKIENDIEKYIRYLNASLYDFKGKTLYLKRYITSFLFSSILFLALSPQFYGFMLPILFFLPIYLGLKGVKQRSMAGFYMTMSVVPVSFMTALTWIRYGFNVIKDYDVAVSAILNQGLSEGLARNLVYIGPFLSVFLLLFSLSQLYRGIKSKDLFI